jgi:hypothetical protein
LRIKWHYRSNVLKTSTNIPPNIHKYILFSAAQRTFSKIDHIIGHKLSLNKYKKTEIISCNLSDNNGIKLEINNKRNYKKYSNTQRLSNSLLSDQRLIEKIRRRIKQFSRIKQKQNRIYQSFWDMGQAVIRRKFMDTSAFI